MREATWYGILLAARRVAKNRSDGCFTSLEVGSEAEIRPSARSSASNIASAWCGKFVRWGYSRPVGKEIGRGRPVVVYKLTRWGLRFRPAARSKVAANPKRKQ